MPTGIAWKIGGEATVTFNIRNNHGGGYQYRLCPATEELSEACFQKTPLDFVRSKQALIFNNGTRFGITGTWVDEAADKIWCRACPPGTYGLVEAAISMQEATSWDGDSLDPGCLPCANGTYNPGWGQTECLPCPTNMTTDVLSEGGEGTPAYCSALSTVMPISVDPMTFGKIGRASCRERV